jgi:hypothetical protein
MTTFLIIYAAVSLFFGGLAATFEIWDRPTQLERADRRGTFTAPKFNPFWIGLFVAALWPVLLIEVLL